MMKTKSLVFTRLQEEESSDKENVHSAVQSHFYDLAGEIL